MNQALANSLNEEGAIILVLNMQTGAEIGLDYNSWLVGEQFMGFKMINPGFHCLFYSSVSKENEFSSRTIVPLFLHSKEVFVLEWDPKEEQLFEVEKVDYNKAQQYKNGASQFQFDKQTAYYPFETIGKWMSMTSYITQDIYKRLTDPSAERFILDDESDHQYNYTQTVNISALIDPKRFSSQHKTPQQISQLYLDSSEELNQLAGKWRSFTKSPYFAILGEFEFSFIMFHIGQDFESLLQWKNILFLYTHAFSCLTESKDISVTSFLENIMKVTYFQLNELEEDFFSLNDGTEGNGGKRINSKNFVIKCLEALKEIIEEEPEAVLAEVKSEFTRIEKMLKKRFQIQIVTSSDVPTVVSD